MFRTRAGSSTVRRSAMSRARRAVTWLLVSVEDDGLTIELFPAGHLGHAQIYVDLRFCVRWGWRKALEEDAVDAACGGGRLNLEWVSEA